MEPTGRYKLFVLERPRGLGQVAWLLFVVYFGVAFPWSSFDGFGLLVAVAVAGLSTFAISWAFGRKMYLSASLMVAFTLVYTTGLGDAVALGVARVNIVAPAETVLEAIVVFMVFAILTGLVARLVQMALTSRLAPQAPQSSQHLGVREGAVIVFFGVVLFVAWSADSWTYWIAERAQAREGSGLEHMYPPMLFLAVALGAYRRTDTPGVVPRTERWRLVLSFIVGVLIFLLQSRRLMVAAAVLLGLTWLGHQRTMTKTPFQARFYLPVLGLVTVLMFLGSSGWRDIDSEDQSVGLMDRLERAVTGLDDSTARESIDARLTYLWFDAMARDTAAHTPMELDLGDLAAASLARAIPRAFFPSKDDIPSVVCETPFEDLGFDEDLPCTPQTEAWLAGGAIGVGLAILLWGLFIGLAEVLVARGPGLGRIFGALLFFPFTQLETGVFPMVQGLRLGLIGILFIGGLYLVGIVVLRATPSRKSA